MTKSLVVSGTFTPTNGRFGTLNASANSGITETLAEVPVLESMTLSNLSVLNTAAAGTGSATLRKNGAAATQTVTFVNGLAVDSSNTDSFANGDDVCTVTTAGSSPSVTISYNVEFASGHGGFMDAGNNSATGISYTADSTATYLHPNGTVPDATGLTESVAQARLYGYDSIEAIHVRVSANSRTTDTTFKTRINGADGNGIVTIGSGLTGTFSDTAVGDTLSAGDDYCLQIATGTGGGSITVRYTVTVLKSSTSASDQIAHWGGSRTASATPNYYSFVPRVSVKTTETEAQLTPRFAARCGKLRANVTANTYSGSATLKLMVNGAAQITLTITAGATGWIANTSDTFDIDDNDTISLELDEGTANSITIRTFGLTFDPIPPPAGTIRGALSLLGVGG